MGMPSGAYSSQQAPMKEKRPHGFQQFAINNYTPEQQRLFGDSFQHLGKDSYLNRLAMGDQSMFDEIEAPALRQFNQLQGGLASRFSGMGLGARKGSGFQNTMNAAAQDFAGQLQSQRSEMRNKAILDLMGLSNQLLNQRPQEKGYAEKPHKESFMDSALKWYTAYQGGSNSGGGNATNDLINAGAKMYMGGG